MSTPAKPGSRRYAFYKYLADKLMPGEVRKEARRMAMREQGQGRRAAIRKRRMILKIDDADIQSALERRSKNDVIVLKEKDSLLWRRQLRPSVLVGIYETSSWLHAGVDEVVRWVVADGWDIVPRKGAENPDPAERMMLMDFFGQKNPDNDYIEDISQDVLTDKQVLGDGGIEKGRDDSTGELKTLFTTDAEVLFIKTDLAGNILNYTQRDPRTRRNIGTIDPEDFVHIRRNARGRSHFGAPVSKPLFLAISSDIFAQVWNRDQFKHNNAARKAWIFDEATGDEAMESNEAALTEAQGPGATHQDILMRAAGREPKIVTLNARAEEMAFEILRRMSREEILAVIGVPPMLVGIIEAGSIGGNIGRDQLKKFYNGLIVPEKFSLERAYTDEFIVMEFGITDWVFRWGRNELESQKERADTEKTQAETDKILVESGIELVDERRAARGKPPLSEVQEQMERAEDEKVEKGLDDAEAGTEIAPVPGVPILEPSVVKLKAGIISVLKRWRNRARVRIREVLSKQEFGIEDFDRDIRDREMQVVLAAGIATAARAGVRNGRRLGGAATDDVNAVIRPIGTARAAELAGEIASDVRNNISAVIASGVEGGLGAQQIADDILKVFDEPRVVQVAATVDAETGAVLRAAHERRIPADVWADTVARTEASDAASQGSLASLSAAGITAVKWRTARTRVDRKICRPLNGKVFSLQDALRAKLIPAHPNCRCTFVPAKPGEPVTGTVAQVRGLQRKHDFGSDRIHKGEGGDAA